MNVVCIPIATMVNSWNNINHGGWKNLHDKILIVVVPKKVMVASGRDKRDKICIDE